MAHLPSSYFAANFDFTALRNAFVAVDERIAALENRCNTLTEENKNLSRDIHEATERAEVSQKQFTALYDVVNALNSNFSGLQANFIARDDVVAKVKHVISLVDSVNGRCDELYEKKMDAHSIALENRVKEIAYETSTRHISLRDKEQRDWFASQLSESETKLTEMIFTTQRELRGQVENELDVLRRGAEDIQRAVQAGSRDADTAIQLLTGLDKAFVAKMEAHEKSIDAVEASAQREADGLRRVIKSVLHAFGTDIARITMDTNDSEILDDADDVQRTFFRDVSSVQRQHDNANSWRVIKALHPGVAAALVNPPPDEQVKVELRPLEVRRDDRLRAIDIRNKQLSERASEVVDKIPVPKAGHAILGGPLMLEARESTVALLKQHLQALQKEIASDFGSQVQTLQRELRSKIGSQRVVELIEQFANQTVQAETKKFASQLSAIQDNMMHKEDILTALTGKADARALSHKADNSSLIASIDAIEKKLSDTRDTLSERLIAMLDAKARELHAEKLDRRDPTYVSIVNLVNSGQAFQTPSLTADGRCVSCGVVSGSVPLDDALHTPTRGARVDTDQMQRDREGALQAVQNKIHATQMSSSATQPSSQVLVAGVKGGRVGSAGLSPSQGQPADWVQILDTKFKSRTIVPAPPTTPKR